MISSVSLVENGVSYSQVSPSCKKCRNSLTNLIYVLGDCFNERFEMGNVYTGYIAKPGLNNRDVSRNGCKLFGFSLTERIPVTDEGDSGEVNCETEFQASRPSLERNCTAERALYALCAAPL